MSICETCWGTGWDPDDPGGAARCYDCGGSGERERVCSECGSYECVCDFEEVEDEAERPPG